MLTSHCKQPRPLHRSTAASGRARRGLVRPRQPQQALLAVARCCRDCGARLTALEGALHSCTVPLEWPCGGTEVAGGPWPQAGTGVGGAGCCRILRLRAGVLAPAVWERFHALWDFVRQDLSHGLDPPTPEAVTAGASAILLGVRGREVVGLIWAERVDGPWCLRYADAEEEAAAPAAAATAGAAAALPAAERRAPRAALGVALVWVRRTERRRGLATALVDAARRQAAVLGGRPVPPEEVAFSQPTSLGLAFARQYAGDVHRGRALVYQP